MGGVDPDVMLLVTKVDYRPKVILRNLVHNGQIIRNLRSLHNGIIVSGHKLMQEHSFIRHISPRYHQHDTCRGIRALVNSY